MVIEQLTGPAPRASEDHRALGERARIHAALADPHRLAIVDELSLSDRSPTELHERLEISSNLLAHHLDVLEDARLVERLASAGDRRRKYVRLLPETLAAIWVPGPSIAPRTLLFVCTGNSARSQLAAALWNARHDVPAGSAGTSPAGRMHPEAIRAAELVGLDLRGARPRSIDEIEGEPDLVVTVCDRAHEHLGTGPGDARLHWSTPDPAEGGIPAAFDDTLRRLSERVEFLAARVAHRSQAAPAGRPHGRRTRP